MADIITNAIEQIRANDATLTVFVANPSVYRLKEQTYTPALAEALAGNTNLKELRLIGCGLTDVSARALSTAIATNAGLTLLDLSQNRISSDGAVAISEALKTNTTLKELVLLDNMRFGDSCMHAFVEMFEHNITLIKITWRLECRTSTKLNQSIMRHNDKITNNTRTKKKKKEGERIQFELFLFSI